VWPGEPAMAKKKKVIIDELIEQEKELTMTEWLSMKIDEVFVDNIPLDPIQEITNIFLGPLPISSPSPFSLVS
jgi:hypothetical protein